MEQCVQRLNFNLKMCIYFLLMTVIIIIRANLNESFSSGRNVTDVKYCFMISYILRKKRFGYSSMNTNKSLRVFDQSKPKLLALHILNQLSDQTFGKNYQNYLKI